MSIHCWSLSFCVCQALTETVAETWQETVKTIVVHQILFDLPLAQNFWTTYSINRHCSAGFFFPLELDSNDQCRLPKSRAILVESRHLAMNVRIWEHLFHGNPFSWGIVHCQVDRKGWSQDWVPNLWFRFL